MNSLIPAQMRLEIDDDVSLLEISVGTDKGDIHAPLQIFISAKGVGMTLFLSRDAARELVRQPLQSIAP